MDGMGDFVPQCIGGAADDRCEHLRLVAAAPGAMFAGGRLRTFSSERVDMAGGLGMVGGQVCDCGAFGSSPVVFGFNLAV